MRKRPLVILIYMSYMFTTIVSNILINNNINSDVNSFDGFIILISFSIYVIFLAIIEGIALFRVKSFRIILHFLVIVISNMQYYFDLKYLNLLVIQLVLITILFISPFFAIYIDREDEDKRVIAFKYMYSQFMVIYFYIIVMVKFTNMVLYNWILIFIYLVFQYTYKNIRYSLKSSIYIILLLILGWYSSEITIVSSERLYSFDLILIVINFIVLYISMTNHRKFYLYEVKKFCLGEVN